MKTLMYVCLLVVSDFGLIGIHTRPDCAPTEIDALVEVYEGMSQQWGLQVGGGVRGGVPTVGPTGGWRCTRGCPNSGAYRWVEVYEGVSQQWGLQVGGGVRGGVPTVGPTGGWRCTRGCPNSGAYRWALHLSTSYSHHKSDLHPTTDCNN